jgi:hypothetical protein
MTFVRAPRDPEELRKRVTLTTIAALLGVVGAVATLLYEFFPDLKPDPRTDRSAEVSIFAVDRGVSLDSWLRRVSHGDKTYRKRRAAYEKDGVFLSTRGEVAYVDSTVKGFKRRETSISYSIYDQKTKARLPTRALSDVVGSTRKLDAPNDRAVVQLWLPPIIDPKRRFYVRVEVRDSDDNILAVADSKPFHGLRMPKNRS